MDKNCGFFISGQFLNVCSFFLLRLYYKSFVMIATTRWFGLYLDWTVVIYLTGCISSFLLMPSDFLGGDVGVAINACLYLTGALQYGMRQSAEVENMMTSVERVMEYGELKTEKYSPNTDKMENSKCKFYYLLTN